jgi:hypothetical protein
MDNTLPAALQNAHYCGFIFAASAVAPFRFRYGPDRRGCLRFLTVGVLVMVEMPWPIIGVVVTTTGLQRRR